MLTAFFFSILALGSDSVRITGHCFNVADQRIISNCNITLVSGTSKQKISVDKSGTFTLKMPESAKSLNFEAEGFEKRSIDVNHANESNVRSIFQVAVPMLPRGLDPAIKEDETIFPKTQLFLAVAAPDSLSIHVVLMDESMRKVAEHRPIISPPTKRHLTVNYILPGPYTLHTGTFDAENKILVHEHSREKVTLREGFNFLSVRYKSGGTGSDGTITMLTPRTLYFDQSSYLLRNDSRIILDSICAVLVRRHNLMAHITGHSDNVGRRSLNLILSEYRSRVVQNYMKMNGVKPGQIQLAWKGPDEPVAANDTEENKIKNRRVVLRFVQH